MVPALVPAGSAVLAVPAEAFAAVRGSPTWVTPEAQAKVADERWARRTLAEVPAQA